MCLESWNPPHERTLEIDSGMAGTRAWDALKIVICKPWSIGENISPETDLFCTLP